MAVRTIIFRGKRKDNGEWIEGDICHDTRRSKGGNEMSKWVSVKDRLPENDTRVLAYCKDRCIHDVKWRWADNAWYDKGSAAVYLAGFVTHWLPMPEPPKEEKQ